MGVQSTRRRVKLYALNAERQWDDRGTGHVSYVEQLQGVSLLVKAEADGSVLLEKKIQPETMYDRQQEKMIVWHEGEDYVEYDLALSFQERAGCDEIWEKICQVQGRDPSVEITHEAVEEGYWMARLTASGRRRRWRRWRRRQWRGRLVYDSGGGPRGSGDSGRVGVKVGGVAGRREALQ